MAHILVVDDEPDILRVVCKILEARGHKLTSAADGEEALEKIKSENPDLVILDLNLPKIDGFDVCRMLKSNPVTAKLPVIMMTAAFTSMDDAHKGQDIGADEYIVKPFIREVLIHNVERLLPDSAKSAV